MKFFTSTCGRINIELHNTSDLYRCFTEISYSQEEMVLTTELYHFNNASYEKMDIYWQKNYNLGTWFYSAMLNPIRPLYIEGFCFHKFSNKPIYF